jgi:threonine synthase
VDTREETTILVATSGDTGAAVAGAFAGRPGFRVVVLYPDGRVSPRQAHQLGAFGGNVRAYRVAGTFDDCQAMVKGAFREAGIHPLPTKLASANSISLGRLLPQMAYYVHAAVVRHAERGGPVSFVIPTGNLGNGLAALLARALRTPSGERLPIENVHLATNANAVVGDYLRTGTYEPKASVATLANAMDVGAPSNLERLQSLADVVGAASLRATSVEDTRIRATISQVFGETGYAICPHTACGVAALMDMSVTDATNWVVASTAHPAKFESIVEPLCGPVAPPPALAALLARPSEATPMPATLASLLQALSAP